jgi:hypothetical protein
MPTWALAPEQIAGTFDDQCVQRLAVLAKLPRGADMTAFADGVRDAARLYADAARQPSGNQLHAEIQSLYRSAARRDYDQLAGLLESLSDAASDLLRRRRQLVAIRVASAVVLSSDRLYRTGVQRRLVEPELPARTALRDPAERDAACIAMERLCRLGGRYVEGRLRRPGKRSRPTWKPDLYAPTRTRHSAKRAVEREFLTLLQFAWLEATGKLPALTARHETPGPFARLVKECLRLMGASHVDAVELINEQHRRR